MSPHAGTPRGITARVRPYTFSSWTEPGSVGETATTRTRRRSRGPRPARSFTRTATTCTSSACRSFLPESYRFWPRTGRAGGRSVLSK